LLAAIDRSKRAELWRVINGMGLPQVGAAVAKELALKCGSLAGLAERGPKTAAVLAQPRYQRLIAELISVGFSPAKPITPRTVSASAPLAGKLFVLTGRLPHLTRAQATARIEAAGGRIASALSGSTHFAVAGEDPGAKLARAGELGVTILDEAALLRMLDAQ
jgi:DNA ligase (NAD+)